MTGTVILFVPHLGVFGGVERLILSLSAHLVQRQYSVRIACFKANRGFDQVNAGKIPVDELPVVRNSFREAYALRRYRRTTPVDAKWLFFDLKSAFYNGLGPTPSPYLLHLTDPPSLLPADITKVSWTVAHRLGQSEQRPVIQRARGEVAHWFTKRGVKRASRTIVMTQRIAQEVRDLYGVESTVVPPGVGGDAKAKATKYDGGPIRILSVSRLEQSKRLDHVIRALAELSNQDTNVTSIDWKLDIIGIGDARDSLMELASRLSIQNRVMFHGQLADAQVDQLYKESHLFVMPAVQGYGLPALEALLRGLPVILHRDSGVSEFLASSAWVTVISRVEDLGTAISQMFGRIIRNQFLAEDRPQIPTEHHWCEDMTRLLREAT